MGIYVNPGNGAFEMSVYLPKRNLDRPALTVELKWKKSAEDAVAQIKDRAYTFWLKGYTGKILLVGINYDEKKGHTCVIEEYVKE